MLRESEARVRARRQRQERRRSARFRVDELLDAPLGHVGERARHVAEVVERHRQALTVVEARAEDLALLGHDERVVRHSVQR